VEYETNPPIRAVITSIPNATAATQARIAKCPWLAKVLSRFLT
jgi:hypothetical protein